MVVVADGLRVGLRDRGDPGARGDIAAFFQVFFAGEYDFLLSRISRGSTVVDAGANIGCFSLLASRKVGHDGLVIAVEPEASNAACLRANLGLNDVRNVVVIEKALSETAGLLVHIAGTGGMAHVADAGHAVVTTTLDEICQQTSGKQVNAIKVDIEGAEKQIFASHSTSSVLGSAQAVAVEVHDALGLELVRNRLRDEGYSFVSGLNSESRFLKRSLRRGMRRPDLVARLYGAEVAPVVTRLISGAFRKRSRAALDPSGLVFAAR